jgi:hypothetical protein
LFRPSSNNSWIRRSKPTVVVEDEVVAVVEVVAETRFLITEARTICHNKNHKWRSSFSLQLFF